MMFLVINIVFLMSICNIFAFGVENQFQSLRTLDTQDKSGHEISGIQKKPVPCNNYILEPQAVKYYFETNDPIPLSLIRQGSANTDEISRQNFQALNDEMNISPKGYYEDNYLNNNLNSRDGYYIIHPDTFQPISQSNSIQYEQIIPQEHANLNADGNSQRYTRTIPDKSKEDIWERLLHDSMLNNILPTMPIPYVRKSAPYLEDVYGPYGPTYGALSNRNGCGLPIYFSCTPRITYDSSILDRSWMYPSYIKESEAQDSPKKNMNSKLTQ